MKDKADLLHTRLGHIVLQIFVATKQQWEPDCYNNHDNRTNHLHLLRSHDIIRLFEQK